MRKKKDISVIRVNTVSAEMIKRKQEKGIFYCGHGDEYSIIIDGKEIAQKFNCIDDMKAFLEVAR